MIVVSADDDCLVGERALAVENSNNVFDFRVPLDDFGFAGGAPAGKLEAARSQVTVDFALEGGQVLAAGGFEDVVDGGAGAEKVQQLILGAGFAGAGKRQHYIGPGGECFTELGGFFGGRADGGGKFFEGVVCCGGRGQLVA